MKTVKEYYDRVREEFEIVNKCPEPCINSAMMNVDNLIQAVRAEERAKHLTTNAVCNRGL